MRPAAPPPAVIPFASGTSWAFTIRGAPATKKNSQRIVTQKATGRHFIIQSASATGWEKTAILQLQSQWHQRGAIGRDVAVAALVYRERAVGDLLNYLAAVHDAIEKAGVVINDKWIVNLDGSRLLKDAANPRVEIRLTVL